MICHSINIIKKATKRLNPGHNVVITFDQPLYALAKQIQWKWPDTYGENEVVIVLGGLHIKMGVYKVLGHWLENNGWLSALIEANVTTAGRANSMIDGSHVTRTRWAHQVTVASLSILQRKAYTNLMEQQNPDDIPPSFDEWREAQAAAHAPILFLEHGDFTPASLFTVCKSSARRKLPVVHGDVSQADSVVFRDRSYTLCKMGASPHQRYW